MERIQEDLSRTRFEKAYGDYIADLKKSAVYNVFVREVPTQLGRRKAKPPAEAATADEEITTSGPAAPERIVGINIPTLKEQGIWCEESPSAGWRATAPSVVRPRRWAAPSVEPEPWPGFSPPSKPRTTRPGIGS